MNTELLETYTKLPAQHQDPPGEQEKMVPRPIEEDMAYVASGKLKGKAAIITGGDSGIGRSVAIQFAKEGADVCIVYLSEEDDAEMTAARIDEIGRRAIQFEGDNGGQGTFS